MQENGRMNWLEQIHQMKNRDIRTIEQHELQELPQDAVEHRLPQEERLKNLLDKVGNPYCYLDNGIIVKLNFAPRGGSTLSERVGRSYNDYIAGHQMNLFEDFIGYQGSAVLDEPEQKTDTISVPIPQCEEPENIPLPDLQEQPENVQRPGSEVVEKGMLT